MRRTRARHELPATPHHPGNRALQLPGRTRIDDAFARAGVVPDIAISALDADVIKSYVELGLGVGIIAAMAFDMERDTKLRPLEATGLFETNTSSLGVRRGRYLRA